MRSSNFANTILGEAGTKCVADMARQLDQKAGAPFTLRFGVPTDFQKLVAERPDRPVVTGELNPVFQGTYSVDYPVLMAGLTIAAVPIILVCLLMQKHIIKGLSSGAVFG